MQTLASRYPGDIHLEEVGRSFLNRPIHLLTLGVGEKNILFWSQMHGDEASATPALLDMANYLLANSNQPASRAILENYTLLMFYQGMRCLSRFGSSQWAQTPGPRFCAKTSRLHFSWSHHQTMVNSIGIQVNCCQCGWMVMK